MALYLLTEWENNHYDDSDFYAGVYDDQRKVCKAEMIGTTRFAGGIEYPEHLPLTDKIADEAIAWLIYTVTEDIHRVHDNKRKYPDHECTVNGSKVIVSERHRNVMFEWIPCPKCEENPGDWVNPNNLDDVRTCFGCNGLGIVKTKNRVKDLAGKQCWRIAYPDELGTVHAVEKDWGASYEKQDRFNTTCLVEFPAGKMMHIPLRKLTLDLPDLLDEEVYSKQAMMTNGYPFHRYLGAVAWQSRNYIAEYQAERLKKESEEAFNQFLDILDRITLSVPSKTDLGKLTELHAKFGFRIPSKFTKLLIGDTDDNN